ncbi:hypothetical protein HDU85_007262 [Gaertneriomyces sp. JEL0708]|nr:hypothetical protein HDU85_007262 [Gaertneriomyces sp. JEL0708]
MSRDEPHRLSSRNDSDVSVVPETPQSLSRDQPHRQPSRIEHQDGRQELAAPEENESANDEEMVELPRVSQSPAVIHAIRRGNAYHGKRSRVIRHRRSARIAKVKRNKHRVSESSNDEQSSMNTSSDDNETEWLPSGNASSDDSEREWQPLSQTDRHISQDNNDNSDSDDALNQLNDTDLYHDDNDFEQPDDGIADERKENVADDNDDMDLASDDYDDDEDIEHYMKVQMSGRFRCTHQFIDSENRRQQCEFFCAREADWDDHVRSHGVVNARFSCSHCDLGSDSKLVIKMHLATAHYGLEVARSMTGLQRGSAVLYE